MISRLRALFALTLICLACSCGETTTAAATNIAAANTADDDDGGAGRPEAVAPIAAIADAEPISQFVRRIHEDRRGHLWLGTNGDGVARWNGEQLDWFSPPEGFRAVAVRGIVDGADGNVWFGTERGLIEFDGVSFTCYTEQDGLPDDDVWCLTFDRRGELWVGTLEGACRFDGTRFTPFELPVAEADPTRGVTSARIVHGITEDRSGRLWFGTNGGAYVYDGTSTVNYDETDGLSNDSVNCIIEDRTGRIWFATHHGGVCYLDGEAITAITEADGVDGTEVWDLFVDRAGDVWFPVENSGVYRFDGETFRRYGEVDGLTSNAIQCTHQDRSGRIRFGGYRGLFQLEGERIVAVTRDGPWR